VEKQALISAILMMRSLLLLKKRLGDKEIDNKLVADLVVEMTEADIGYMQC